MCFPANYKVTVENCILRNNTAGLRGGAISCLASNGSILRNSLLAANVCGTGGGVYLSPSGCSIINCTIVSNTDNGIFIVNSTYETPIINSIIYSNKSDVYLEIHQTNWFYHCCVGTTRGAYPLPESQGNIRTYPKFVSADPAAPDYRLQSDSPCVNTGTNQAWMEGATDIEGLHRLDRWQRRVDLGAYEYLGRGTLLGIR